MNKRHYEHTLPNIRGSLSNTYVYNPDTVIVNKIEQTGRGLSVDLFGEILLGYDEEKDLLYLSTEGEYVRADEL